MIKQLLLICYMICVLFDCFSQSVGLKANFAYSTHPKIQNNLGAGIFVSIEDSSKISFLASFNIQGKEKKFYDANFSQYYLRVSGDISGLYPLVVYKTFKIKIGPLISYSKTMIEEQGISLSWIRSINVSYLGLGVLSDVQINHLFRTPLSLHFFVSPEYLLRLKSETNGGSMTYNYDKNLGALNAQLGISYLVK